MKKLIVLIFVIICGYTFIHHLSNEFWNDEFYTLVHFVLVPLKTTLLDYQVPNNHILFSLLARSYLSVIGFTDLKIILENPVIARLPLALIAIALLYYYWKTTSFFFEDTRWRLISMLLLCSNVVFGNFVFQYRGYGISALFLIIIFYHLLKIINTDKSRVFSYTMLMLASLGAFYTTPSNLYFIVILGMFPGLSLLINKGMNLSIFKSPEFKAGIFILVGILLGLLCYSPIFKDVFNNKYVTNSAPFEFENFERMFKALLAQSSFHFVLFIFGIYYLISNLVKKKLKTGSRYWFPVMLCCLPGFFSFLHGDVPPDRVYSVLVPFITILLTYSLVLISQQIWFLKANKGFVIIPVYLIFHFALSELYISKCLAHDNSIGQRDQDLTLQYHNYHFNSPEMIKTLQSDDYKDIPVYFENQFDNTNILTDAYGIKTSIINTDSIVVDKCILITNKPFSLQKILPFQSKIITRESSYFKLYMISKRQSTAN